MKNKFSDLHNHLFAQLERLNDSDLEGEELLQEIRRGHAMSQVAAQLIANGNLAIKAHTAADQTDGKMPLKLLTG